MVSLWDFELFPVYWVLIFQMDFVFVVSGQSQVVLVDADGLLVSVEEVQVLGLEFIRDLEMASSGNVFFGQPRSRSIGNVTFDNGADSGCGLVRERIELVFLNFNNSHDVVPFYGDLIGSAVFNDDLAVLVAVNGDKGRDPCQCWCPWAVYGCNICLVWMNVPVELRCDDAGGHSRNGDLFSSANCVHLLVGEFDLSCVDVVDQFVAVHEVDANNVVVQLLDDVHWMCKFLPLDIKVHLVNSKGVHCISRSGDAALRVGDFLGLLVSKGSIERSAVHASDGCSSVK
jgi:hypothetical protein